MSPRKKQRNRMNKSTAVVSVKDTPDLRNVAEHVPPDITRLVKLALWNKDGTKVFGVLTALAEHCSTLVPNGSKYRKLIYDANGYVALVRVLERWSRVPVISAAALKTLQTVASDFPAFIIAAVAAGAFEAVLMVMKGLPQDVNVQKYGCGALVGLLGLAWLRPLSDRPDYSTRLFVDLCGAQVLVDTMKSFPNCAPLQKDACWALCNACQWEHCRGPIAAADAHRVLLDAVENFDGNSIIQHFASRSLMRLLEKYCK